MPHGAERREAVRKKIKVKKIFAAKITADSQLQQCFFHIFDISETGMRIHSDIPLPLQETVNLSFVANIEFSVNAKCVWKKELAGGMYILGIQFMDVTEEQLEAIRSITNKYSPDNKRTNKRLQRFLSVELNYGETQQQFSVFTLDISQTGMRITYDSPLPENQLVPMTVQLEYDKPPIQLQAKVVHQALNSIGQYVIGLNFENLDEQTRERIGDFIESASDNFFQSNNFGSMTDDEFSDIL